MFKVLLFGLKTSLLTIGYSLTINSASLSQVTSDGTIDTQVNQNGNVAEITGGETRGSNLFHSFQDFSVGTGNEAFFDNSNDIGNIFSRVTGGNVSNIDGSIRANNANLFLINPAGILFGAGARLDLGSGSFYGSSANGVLFEDGEFSANLENPPVLTINAPIGLSFRDNPADIAVRGNGNGTRLSSEPVDTQDALRVNEDATIGFIGGNLIFEDATIKTAGGRIEVGSVAGGRVDLVEEANGFSFDYSGVDTFQDISLSGTTAIDASGNGGGDINFAGRNITLEDISQIEASTLADEAGSTINIFATDSIDLSGVENENNFISGIVNQVYSNATGDGGDINIETGSLSIGDRAAILTNSSGQSNAGNITIDATDSISIVSQGNIFKISSAVNADGTGDAGNITISAANSIRLEGQANRSIITSRNLNENSDRNAGDIAITTSSFDADNGALFANHLGRGNAGNISIDATENIALNNTSLIEVIGSPGGSIDINAQSLSILSGSDLLGGLSNSSISDTPSGDIIVNLTEDLIIDKLDSDSNSIIGNSNLGQGDVGKIEVNARNMTFNNEGKIFSFSEGEGDVGSITLNASENISFDGLTSGIANTIEADSTGNIGAINISAQNLSVTNGAIVRSLVSGNANSGDINLNIADTITIDRSGDFVNADGASVTSNSLIASEIVGGIGDGGSINIDTTNLTLSRNGSISTKINQGQGNAGDVNINAEAISIGEQGDIFAIPSSISSNSQTGLSGEPLLEANAGNIAIDTASLSIDDGGSIDAVALARGNGGNITINATDISVDGMGTFINPTTQTEIQRFSSIRADAFNGGIGDSGSIKIDTANFSLTNGADLRTSNSGEGNAGNILINATDTLTASNNSLIVSNIGNSQEVAAVGNVGTINISAREINFSDTAQIQAGLFPEARGDSGIISVNATESISFSGENTGIFSDNEPGSVGDASDTQLSAPNIFLANGAVIQAANRGDGNGGNITIDADNLNLDRNNSINATTSSGVGGIVTLQVAENITLRGTNAISAGALEDANGGNINIDTNFIIAFPNGNNDIIANAQRGNGGNININAESLFGIQERGLSDSTNDINASSEFSLDGNITINTPDINPVQGATELPQNIVETGQTTAQTCQANREAQANNGLSINGKGGIPPAPDLPLNSQTITINGENNPTSTIPQPIETSQGKIQPARGIEVTETGKVILTAYRTNNSGDRLLEKSWCR